jgi:hypothetical protein
MQQINSRGAVRGGGFAAIAAFCSVAAMSTTAFA